MKTSILIYPLTADEALTAALAVEDQLGKFWKAYRMCRAKDKKYWRKHVRYSAGALRVLRGQPRRQEHQLAEVI